MNDMPIHSRQTWVALVLSLLCTGLGHVYCGRVVKGLVLFLVSLLFWPFVALASLAGPATWILSAIVVGAFAVAGIYLYAAIDAFRWAKKLRAHYEPREYNYGVVYVLFVLVGVIYPIGSATLVRANVLEAFFIPTSSMTPNILKNDRVFVNKLAFHDSPLRRGHVIVFRAPGQRAQRFVKRVIGLPGDTVAIRGNEVHINGKKLKRERLPTSYLADMGVEVSGKVYDETNSGGRYMVILGAGNSVREDYPETIVPDDKVFVLGDNRDKSRDSRDFGCVPLGDVLGPIEYIYLPAVTWRRFGVFSH